MDFNDLSGLSDHAKLNLALGYLGVKAAGSFYSSVRTGGGLVRIVKSFFLGENLPAPVAKDYHEELKSQPTPPESPP
jgi:hypothetical protein